MSDVWSVGSHRPRHIYCGDVEVAVAVGCEKEAEAIARRITGTMNALEVGVPLTGLGSYDTRALLNELRLRADEWQVGWLADRIDDMYEQLAPMLETRRTQ